MVSPITFTQIRTNLRMLSLMLSGFLLLGASQVMAEQDRAEKTIGHDSFIAGESLTLDKAYRNVFAAGEQISLLTALEETAYMAGGTINIDAPIAGSAYLFGETITISDDIAGALSAAGRHVRLSGMLDGNGRIFAKNVTIDGNVKGELNVFAQTLNLNGTIEGGINFYGDKLNYGSDAKILGHIETTPIDPEMKEKFERHDRFDFADALIASFFIFGFGSLLLWVRRKRFEVVSRRLAAHPRWSFLRGLMVALMLLGAVPALALTIIGLPLLVLYIPLLALVFFVMALMGAALIAHSLLFAKKDFKLLNAIIALAAALVATLVVKLIAAYSWQWLCLINYFFWLAAICFGLSCLWPSKKGKCCAADKQEQTAEQEPATE